MIKGTEIKFDASKNFTYVKPLGSGGTGDTHLFKDETTDMQFAIKKYVPKDKNYIEDQYVRFVDEIKILFNISHQNIVRIFNYYLYPHVKTGFLQMEYIEGETINKIEPIDFWKTWSDIFSETINAFLYLENKKILHRDIRPENIMVDKNGSVKIIDFGFGKRINTEKSENNSILLNWPATQMPNEIVMNRDYNNQTEIYFLGVLFSRLLKNNNEFIYFHIIDKMIQVNPEKRYLTFSEIAKDISSGVISENKFSKKQKDTYQVFANELVAHIYHYIDKYIPLQTIYDIKVRLAEVIRSSALEEYIQDNRKLIKCFIDNGYSYNTKKDIKVEIVRDFYEMITNLSFQEEKILYDNIFNRLSNINVVFSADEDDLPF